MKYYLCRRLTYFAEEAIENSPLWQRFMLATAGIDNSPSASFVRAH
jgi:hypothetical protein